MYRESAGKMEINISHDLSSKDSFKKVKPLREFKKEPYLEDISRVI